MKYIPLISTVTALLIMSPAHAGLLDAISKAADAVKQVQDTASNATGVVSSANNNGQPAQGASANHSGPANGVRGDYALPFNLDFYPRAKVFDDRLYNPYDRTYIPLTPPKEGGDGMRSAYNLPIEGKVTMVSFEHPSDDSPILLERHWQSWLTREGFSWYVVCQAPCEAANGTYDWKPVVDQTDRYRAAGIPDHATWIVGKRADAAVIIGVGRDGDRFLSFLKAVEGAPGDLTAWNIVTAQKHLNSPVGAPEKHG